MLERLHVGTKQQDISADAIPISIFHSNLSALEAIVVYLVDHVKFSKSAAAKTLNRNPNTIYTTYSNAKKKLKTRLNITSTPAVPIDIFSDRKFAILESLTNHLKHHDNIRLAEIARLLDKSPSTIKTVYARYKKKKDQKQHEHT